VRHLALGKSGQVIELCERGQVRLMIGAMKLLVPARELALESTSPKPKVARSSLKYKSAIPPKLSAPTLQRTSATTLDLRGERVDEALGRVDAFIDRVLSQGDAGGFVLHGHGTGALKSSIREHLRASAYVEHSRPAESDEGGDAFTVFWVRG
jgi:DNA mismatch repair protein MutS2